MGPAPSLSTYEAEAQSEYQPQEQAALTGAAATNTTTLNSLNTQLNDTGAQYNEEEQQLGTTVQQDAAQIAQTYSQHLLGNFSGLQGNDMGELFSNANLQEQSIETQRNNAIDEINTDITNQNITYAAQQSEIQSEYAGEEAQAANSEYASAVSAYDTQEYQQQELALKEQSNDIDEQKVEEDADNTMTSEENTLAASYKATGKTGIGPNGTSDVSSDSNGYNFTGPNGQPIDMAEYVNGATGGNMNSAAGTQTILNLLQNGSSYDKSVYSKVKNLSGSSLTSALSSYSVYGF